MFNCKSKVSVFLSTLFLSAALFNLTATKVFAEDSVQVLTDVSKTAVKIYDSNLKSDTFVVNPENSVIPARSMTTSQIVKAYDAGIIMVVAMDADRREIAMGSGISIGNGLFLTNQHVLDVEGARSYKLITTDDKSYEVEGIVKEDADSDLAIIKSKQLFTLPKIKFGSYINTQRGEKIITIGSPLGLQNTVSEGIVSGIRYDSEYNVNLIQITAPITHGSSGGALFNTRGEVIGITTMGYEEGNLNFAIAADHAMPWINELKDKAFADIAVIKQYIDSSIPANPGSGTTTPPTGSESNNSSLLGSSSYFMDLNFQVTDSVMDTDKPIIYVSDRVNKKLYSINYETKELKQVSFALPPESITYAKGRVYVSLLKQEHDPYIFDGQQKGAFAIVDSAEMKILDVVDIDIDPFDIVVDKDGYIYIANGSGQWTYMKSYDGVTRQQISSSFFDAGSYAEYNPILNKIYFVDTRTSPRDIETRVVNEGQFLSVYDSPYHGDYEMTTKIKISADGQYVFNGSGNIFTSTPMKADDMRFVVKLNKGFTDAAFNGSSQFFTTNGDKNVYAYDYETFKELGRYTTSGTPVALFYKNGVVIAISKVVKASGITGFGIEKISVPVGQSPPAGREEETEQRDPSTGSDSAHKIENIMNLSFQITDSVMDMENSIIYGVDRTSGKLYKVDYKTKGVSSVSFDLPAESVAYANGKVYVTLVKQEHSSYNWEEQQQGAFAIVDAASMTIKKIVDINMDPYDIAAGKDGYVYISSGSGQWTNMKSYNGDTGQEVATTDGLYQGSFVTYNPVLNKLYITTNLSPTDIEARNLSGGTFTEGYDSPYHGDFPLTAKTKVSADGKYIFNSAGAILSASAVRSEDMKLVARLNNPYIDVTFGNNNKFYTSQENGRIYVFDYKTFKGIDSFAINGTAQYLYYSEGKIIAVMKARKFEGSEVYNYSINTIEVK